MKPVLKPFSSISEKVLSFVLIILFTVPIQAVFAQQKAMLDIDVERPGAVVYLNGEKKGITESEGKILLTVPPGNYHLFIERGIHQSVYSYQLIQHINIRSGFTLKVKTPLKRALNPIWKIDFEALLENNKKQPPDFPDLKQLSMLEIPAGEFIMGSNDVMFAKPEHRVKIRAFKIAQHEMTFALYDRFVEQTGYDRPEDDWGRGRQPATHVSWYDAMIFIRWLNSVTNPRQPYRLPTEAEWEYAARGGTQSPYWWGEASARNRATCSDCNNPWYRRTSPVGVFPANPFGLHDTSGNVYEWVQDCWNSHYEQAPQDGSAWLSGYCQYRVTRSGCWFFNQEEIRSASRTWNTPTMRDSTIGFRVAQDGH
jgi:formylglycine-generating enzyme required for sulfatase activity